MLLLAAAILAAGSVQTAGLSAVSYGGDPGTRPSQVHAVRTAAPITIDGELLEAAWATAQPVTQFVQRDPIEGAAATQATEVLLLYDDQALYIGARLHDAAPDSITARLARRDVFISADRFMVFLDPYHDRRTGSYFGINAAGTLYDGTLYNDDWDDDTWDGVWDGKVHREPGGWTAELRIPYSQLRFQRGHEYVWGINFKREIARLNEQDYLVYTPRNGSGFVSRFVELVGLQQVTPPRRLEVLPYATAKAELLDHAAGDPFNDGSRLGTGFGADVKVGLGSNLTLDGSVNPDFGQVEVDPAVVNLSDVETFYPEKRPFFIEGSNIFRFGMGGANNYWSFNWANPNFFYSRRIGRPPQGSIPDATYQRVPDGTTILGAAKLSGKFGHGWSVGALNVVTDRERAELEDAGRPFTSEVEPLTYYGVFRGQKEFGEGRQSLGLISTLTVRQFDDPRLRDELNSNSMALGVDGWTFLDQGKDWVLTGWAGVSQIRGNQARMTSVQKSAIHYFQRPDAGHVSVDSSATSLSGYAGRVYLNKQRGDWRLNAGFGVIDPGFDVNDLGFQFRTGDINMHVAGTRRWTTPGRLFRRVHLNSAIFRTYDYDGNQTWSGLFESGFFQLRNYYGIEWFIAYNPRTISTRLTRGGPTSVNPAGWEGNLFVSSDDRKPLVAGVGVHGNRYQLGADRSWSLNTSIEWKPASAVSIRLEPSFSHSRTAAQYVGTFGDPLATATFGNRYVFGALDQKELSAGVRLNWIFAPKLSLELFAQPLISAGAYRNFKELARPRTYDFRRFGTGGSSIRSRLNPDGTVTYVADPDGAGPADSLEFDNPDFNFKSLRGNAVLRWEYMPGSTIFLVWTQSRSDAESAGTFNLGRSLNRLFGTRANNIFAVKVTYWWNP